MKELLNLKKRALAVGVLEGATYSIQQYINTVGTSFVLSITSQHGNTGSITSVQLPPGSWVILGRVGELNSKEKLSLIEDKIELRALSKWSQYCSKHDLTNELILCEQ